MVGLTSAAAVPQDVKLLRHDLFTNDVLYLELALDLRPLPSNLLPLLPLFCRCASCQQLPLLRSCAHDTLHAQHEPPGLLLTLSGWHIVDCRLR